MCPCAELLAGLAAVLKDFPQVWALSDEVYRTVRCVPSATFAMLMIRAITIGGSL